MQRLLSILFVALCLAGCTKEAPTNSTTPPPQAKETEAPSATPAASNEFPATKEELRERTQEAIEAKDFDALSALVDWADSPSAYRTSIEKTLKSVIDSADDVATVEVIEPTEGQDSIPPIAMEGHTYEITAPISGNLKISYKEASRTNTIPFTESQGRVMFMGLKKVGEAAVDAPIRLLVVSAGTDLTVTLNGKTPPGISANGSTDQDVTGFVIPGVNVLEVTWKHPKGSKMEFTPKVSVRQLDPSTKKDVWNKPVLIDGETGSAKIEFEI